MLIFDANKHTNWFVEQCLDKNDTSSCFASMAISNGASQGTEKHATKQRVQQQNDFYVRYLFFQNQCQKWLYENLLPYQYVDPIFFQYISGGLHSKSPNDQFDAPILRSWS